MVLTPEPKPVKIAVPTPSDLGLSKEKGMVLIKAGNFWMGSSDDEEENSASEYPRHQVWLSAYYIDKYPVTFDQFDKFCDAIGKPHVNDQGWERGKRPAINLTWQDADEYCKWAGKRLPTEAEWEKAAKGGKDTIYFWGDDPGQADDYAWFARNSELRSHPVGSKKPNRFGLYDMVGNVSQWTADWYDTEYYPVSPAKDPKGPQIKKGKFRALRGSSWFFAAETLRVANRGGDDPKHASIYTGCRCAKSPDQPTPEP
jgi:formylglycine-generating enzyme required for sulfatase activity